MFKHRGGEKLFGVKRKFNLGVVFLPEFFLNRTPTRNMKVTSLYFREKSSPVRSSIEGDVVSLFKLVKRV